MLPYILKSVVFEIIFSFIDCDVGTRFFRMGTAGNLASDEAFTILFNNHSILAHLFLNENDFFNSPDNELAT